MVELIQFDGHNNDATLRYADFSGGFDLSGANFDQSDLARANFTGANLTRASFHCASLRGVDFTGAVVNGTRFFHRLAFITKEQLYSTASYKARKLAGIGFFIGAGGDGTLI